MSLVIKSLNKLKSSKNTQGVPPALTGAKTRKTGKILYILFGGLIVSGLVMAVVSGFLLENQTDINKEARRAEPAPVFTGLPANVSDKHVNPFKTPEQLNLPVGKTESKPASLPKTRQSAEEMTMQSADIMQETVPDTQNIPLEKPDTENQNTENENSGNIQKTEAAEAEQYRKDIKKYMKSADKETIAVNRLIYNAEIQADNGDFAEAAETYGRIYEKTRDSAALHNKAVYLAKAGFADDAAKVIHNSELGHQAFASAATEVAADGDTDTALKILNASDSTESAVLSAYGYVYEVSGKPEQAEQYHKKAFENEPSDAYYAYGYARILDVREKYVDAITVYTRVLELDTEKDLKTAVKKRISYLKNVE